MFALQQINRSIRIKPSILRYISTTKVRQDDNDKPLSTSQKEDIRQKLKSLKEKLLKKNDQGKNAEQIHASFEKSEDSPSQGQDGKPKTELQEKASLVNENIKKEKKQLAEKEKPSLKRLLEHEIVIESESKLTKEPETKDNISDVEKDIDLVEILNKQKATTERRQEVKKQKQKLKHLLEEPAETTEESKEHDTKESEKLHDKGKIKQEVSSKEHVEKVTDDVEKPKAIDEEDRDSEGEKLKGRMKLRELIELSEKFNVEDKVKTTHPEKKIRPVERAGKRAESNQHVKLLKSIKGVADELGGDVEKTETELMDAVFKSTASEESEMKRLEKPTKGKTIQKPTKGKMSSVIDDLNVDLKQHEEKDDSQIEIKKTLTMIRDLQRRSSAREKDSQSAEYPDYKDRASYSLFDAKPLNVFDENYLSNLKETPVLEVYDEAKKKEMIKLVTHSPANIFEEMITWTKQGKLWEFPIDNERKWTWEENVDFSEHILLEHHLEPWCPTGGPIRHFMELVCVGLSKNPYITAEEKREHIYWYRDYFEEKRRLLEDVGALKKETKQIEKGETVS